MRKPERMGIKAKPAIRIEPKQGTSSQDIVGGIVIESELEIRLIPKPDPGVQELEM
jgi:hypothetical protein